MNQPLRVLMVEDSEDDAILSALALRAGGYEVAYEVVETPAAMRAALERQDWDVITSDHSMPSFSAPAALALAKQLRPDLPVIIVSGQTEPSLAISLIKAGAWDYIQKRDLARLVPTIEHKLNEVTGRREREQAKDALNAKEEAGEFQCTTQCSAFEIGRKAALAVPEGKLAHCYATMAKLADYLPQWGMNKTAREVARCLCQSFDLKFREHRENSEWGFFPLLLERASGEDATCLRTLVAQLTVEHAEIQQSWNELRQMLCDIVFCRRNGLSAQKVEFFARSYNEHLQSEDERLIPIASRILGLTGKTGTISAHDKPQM